MKTITVKTKHGLPTKQIQAELAAAAPRSEVVQLFPYKAALCDHWTVSLDDKDAKEALAKIEASSLIESAYIAPDRTSTPVKKGEK